MKRALAFVLGFASLGALTGACVSPFLETANVLMLAMAAGFLLGGLTGLASAFSKGRFSTVRCLLTISIPSLVAMTLSSPGSNRYFWALDRTPYVVGAVVATTIAILLAYSGYRQSRKAPPPVSSVPPINEGDHHSDAEAARIPQNGSSRMFERCGKAAMIGAAIPIVLSVAAGIASWCKTGSFSSLYVCLVYIWIATPEFTLFGVIPSAVAGAVGGAVGRVGRASVYGAIILACVAGECMWFSGWKTWPLAAHISLTVLAFALGALAGGAGAVIARTIPTFGDDKAIPLRLSLWESVIAGILGVILLGYIFLLADGRMSL